MGLQPGLLEVGPDYCPTINDIVEAALGARVVRLKPEAVRALEDARRTYLEEARTRPLYGYCTGLGALQGERPSCGPRYEDRILAEHAAGVGPVAPPWLTRGFLAVWLCQVAGGGHPLRPRLALRVEEVLRKGLIPLVPLYGSVGASGDLAPSAHVFQCLLRGRGRALLDGRILSCDDALKRLGLEPVELEVGEALAAINNTAWSTALAAAGVWSGLRLLEASLRVAVYALSSIGFNPEEFGSGAEAKKHPGQARIARILRGARPACAPERLQDPYSIRCVPQVYGAALEALEWAAGLVEREACSPTTNPVIAEGRAWHGCNFHTIYAGIAVETSSLAVTQLANMTLYRLEKLLDSRINGVSDFLAEPGSSVGAMIIQYTAAALNAELRSEAAPRLANWLPTSLGHEDANPMSPAAALRLLRMEWILSWLIAAEAAIASLIRARKGLGDPLGIGASLEEPAASLRRARAKVIPKNVAEILDSISYTGVPTSA